MACGKFRKVGAIGFFIVGNNNNLNINRIDITRLKQEAMNFLLNKLLPDDNDQNKDETHGLYRSDYETVSSVYQNEVQKGSRRNRTGF